MKKYIAIALVLCFACVSCQRAAAQQLSAEMQAVYDTCLQMRSSIGAGSLSGLRVAGKAFKACRTQRISALCVR